MPKQVEELLLLEAAYEPQQLEADVAGGTAVA